MSKGSTAVLSGGLKRSTFGAAQDWCAWALTVARHTMGRAISAVMRSNGLKQYSLEALKLKPETVILFHPSAI